MTDIPAEAVEDVPSFGTGVDTDYILGIGKSEDRDTLLLDIDRVLSQEEMGTLQTLAQSED